MIDHIEKISTFQFGSFKLKLSLSQKDEDYCGVINAESDGQREGEWTKTKCSKESFILDVNHINIEIGI